MTPFKKTTLALLAATVAATALTASYAVSAREGGHWGGGDKAFGWHMGGGKRGGHMFKRFDTNKDGSISQEEVDAETASLFTAADADKNGIVGLEEFKAQFVVQSEPMRIRAFQRLDRNGDGTVTKEEFDGLSEKIFSRMDRDGDGILEPRKGGKRGERGEQQARGEGENAREDGRGRGGDRDGHHGGKRGGPNPMRMIFSTFDTNGDGKITREEFDTVRGQLFASADPSGTGSFDKDGFSAIWATLNDEHLVRMFQSLDTNGDLGITSEEQQAKTAEMVARMDSNKDGVITKADLKRGMWKHGRGHGRGHDNDRDGDDN